MARLTYAALASLDGYVEDEEVELLFPATVGERHFETGVVHLHYRVSV